MVARNAGCSASVALQRNGQHVYRGSLADYHMARRLRRTLLSEMRKLQGAASMVAVSVVICAYTLDRWDQILAAVDSVQRQSIPPLELYLVIDGNEALHERASRELQGIEIIRNVLTPGLSGARMTGARLATAPVIAFLDDDAVADPEWLERLLEAYRDKNVLGAGGYIEPLWMAIPPRWFPREFDWVIGCTYKGMPVNNGRIRNVIGANMSVRASILRESGGFTTKLGRRDGVVVARGVAESCEETEFCIRATRLNPGGYWAYCPKARVRHNVSAQRTTWRYFVRRCRMEGTAKGILATIAGSKDSLASEKRYVFVLLRSFLQEAGAALCGDRHAASRAAAIFVGVAVTATAYLGTRLSNTFATVEPVGE
jgi:glycosyltransferase involved in cell wall biosynthesis